MRDETNEKSAMSRPGSPQLTLDLGHTPSLAEADFIVSDSNRLAFEHVLSFPKWSAPLTLVLGPPKSGKSHLARIWTEIAHALVATADNLEALATMGGNQPVLVEDVDRSGYAEAPMFHLLNQSMRDARPLLMTARLSVAQWPFSTADVLSRARLAASFNVDVPDDTQLSHMFAKLFSDRQVVVDAKVVSYLVSRMERSTQEAVHLVALMDKIAMARRTPITKNVAAEALSLRESAKDEGLGDESDYERDNAHGE